MKRACTCVHKNILYIPGFLSSLTTNNKLLLYASYSDVQWQDGDANWLWKLCPPNKRDNKIFVPPLKTKFMADNKDANPYQKPTALMEEIIRRFAKEGGVVVDWTAGCGTTAVACAIEPDLHDRAGATALPQVVFLNLQSGTVLKWN